MAYARNLFVVAALALPISALPGAASFGLDLGQAVVVTRPGTLPPAETTAATVLIEEVEKRTGIRLRRSTTWPAGVPAIAITAEARVPGWKQAIPRAGMRAEGYRLYLDAPAKTVWLLGADARGTLYAVGELLRRLDWSQGALSIAGPLDHSTAPAYPIRGHQLGYRATANSYDAFSVAQMEQYIRELTFFGANSVEGIQFQDGPPSPVMKVSRREMNQAVGEICYRYGLDYWSWAPATFDLNDKARRAAFLGEIEQFLRETKTFSGFFFPGGDPGDNPPELVIPFLADVARLMKPIHPKAQVWLSLQRFSPAEVDRIYAWLEREQPEWFGGLVAGPSSPPIPATRRRLAKRYKLRLYPDLTHNKICQYQVPSWDQAYALTLGREAVNPRPAEYAFIHNWFAPHSDGFLSYSDGVHDDVNKTIWSSLAWDPERRPREILVDYARVFFGPRVAGRAADAIQALERNWRGSLADNGSVEGTLLTWRGLERQAPELGANWRWQMCLLRANYDAFVRRRLLRETELENQANAVLAGAAKLGSEQAMTGAMAILNRAVTEPESPELHSRIEELCEKLYHSIGLQTSVKKYHASGAERGAVLDHVDYPLNNRWWLEDEFQKARALGSETARVERLRQLAAWEHPGPGSFYDNVGNLAKAPRVVRGELDVIDPGSDLQPDPTFWWWDQGKSRARLSWQVTLWPRSVIYEVLDPQAAYLVRSSGYGQALLRMNGERVRPTADGREMGDIKEFPVEAKFLKEGRLVLSWDIPTDEGNLNWRKQSRLAEVWLIKR